MPKRIRYGTTPCSECGHRVTNNALGRSQHRCRCWCGEFATHTYGRTPVCGKHGEPAINWARTMAAKQATGTCGKAVHGWPSDICPDCGQMVDKHPMF
jgi:hypothetical protein